MSSRRLAIALIAALGAAGTHFLLEGGKPWARSGRQEPGQARPADPVSGLPERGGPASVPQPGAETSAASVASAPPQRAAGLTPALGAEEFAALVQKTLQELPTRAEQRKLSRDEAHGTPDSVARSGALLARIADAVAANPALAPAAQRFHSRCAADPDLLTPVRALCLSHVLGKSGAPAESDLPSEVVRLAKLVPAQP